MIAFIVALLALGCGIKLNAWACRRQLRRVIEEGTLLPPPRTRNALHAAGLTDDDLHAIHVLRRRAGLRAPFIANGRWRGYLDMEGKS